MYCALLLLLVLVLLLLLGLLQCPGPTAVSVQ